MRGAEHRNYDLVEQRTVRIDDPTEMHRIATGFSQWFPPPEEFVHTTYGVHPADADDRDGAAA